jgi:hypothetical protein
MENFHGDIERPGMIPRGQARIEFSLPSCLATESAGFISCNPYPAWPSRQSVYRYWNTFLSGTEKASAKIGGGNRYVASVNRFCEAVHAGQSVIPTRKKMGPASDRRAASKKMHAWPPWRYLKRISLAQYFWSHAT